MRALKRINDSFKTYSETAISNSIVEGSQFAFQKFCYFDIKNSKLVWHKIKKLYISCGNNASAPDYIEWNYFINPCEFNKLGEQIWENCKIRTTINTEILMSAITVPGKGIWEKLNLLADGMYFDNSWSSVQSAAEFEKIFEESMDYLGARIDIDRTASMMFEYNNDINIVIVFE